MLEWVARGWEANARHLTANSTVVPDALLLQPGTSAIFTTRHPAWVVPAVFRALGDFINIFNRANTVFISGMHWQRQLYDWYLQNGFEPIVVESEDYMTSPDFVRKLCKEAGLDPEHALFTWPRATDEEKTQMGPMVVNFLSTLLDSTGLIPAKAKPAPNLQEEEAKWVKEFGEERARSIKEMVEADMPDYEYLRARKLTP